LVKRLIERRNRSPDTYTPKGPASAAWRADGAAQEPGALHTRKESREADLSNAISEGVEKLESGSEGFAFGDLAEPQLQKGASMSPATSAFAERRRRLDSPERAPPSSGRKLNLGCGPVQPSGWVNIDGSRRAWLAGRFGWLDHLLVRANLLSPTEFGPMVRVHDLLKPLPFANDSVACIYSGELWEHFERPDAVRITHECHRVLAPGGVLRLCVPDGAVFWRRYLEIYDEEMAKPVGAREADRLRDHVQLYFNDIATRRIWLGSLGHTHKWQFDEVQLLQLVRDAGFAEVRRMRFHESRIPDIERVERSDFLIVEGIKPAETASLLPADAVRAHEAALGGDAVGATPQSRRA
jgi:predicted SAM-dependent methyltransferase